MSPLLQSNVPGLALGTYSAADPASAPSLVLEGADWGFWLAGVVYTPGAKVANAFDGGQYVARKQTLGVRPDTDPSSWLAVGGGTPVPPGPWEALALGAKIQEVAGPQTARVRSETGATVAKLRGKLAVKPPEELFAGETLFTLPVGVRPPGRVDLPVVLWNGGAYAFNEMRIAATGVATLLVAVFSISEAKMAYISLDNIDFNIA